MRKFLLAIAAAALLFGFAVEAAAERSGNSPEASTLAPLRTTTATGLMFSKNTEDAAPIEQRESVSPAAPADRSTPLSSSPVPNDQAAPAEQATKPVEDMKPGIAAEDAALADQLRDLVENKLPQFVPKEQDRAGVLAFYRSRNFAPLWIAGGKAAPRAKQASEFLRGVAADGLDPADYPTPAFDGDAGKLAADELTLTNSVVVFARHATIGRTAFSRVSGAVWYDQKPPNPADVLGKLAESADVRATLDGFNPQAPGYKALKVELAAVRNGKDAVAEPKPAAKNEAKKDSKAAKKSKHEAKEAKAAKPAEGASKAARIDTIVANMERWRWMPHQLGAAYVMVNVADYTLKVVKDGKTIWQTKIVVGKPGAHATPLLTETMKYITVNPTWNVPPSIIKNEYLPVLARDPDALSRVGLKVGHNPDGSVRIYQPPGERNALGRIRFNFPNRFLVYQHDTPDKKLFDLASRAYSHGCMRVQNPDEYAEVLLKISQPQDNYTAAKIRSMYGSSERSITFKNPIPVYVTYQTAFVDDAGKSQFRADIYGLDKDVNAVLHGDRRVADVPMARNYNSGSKPVMASSAGRSKETSGAGWNANASYIAPDRTSFTPPDRTRVW